MAALRGRDSEIAEAGFNDHARAADFVPLYRDAQPGLGRSPASDADQKIRAVLFSELTIEARHRRRDFLTAAAFETLRVHDYYIVKIVDAAVAQHFAAQT